MAQRSRVAPQPARTNTPQAPAPKSSGRGSGWRVAFLVFCAICIAGIVPVFLAGQLFGIWHVNIPYTLPPPFPSPTPALVPHLTSLRLALMW